MTLKGYYVKYMGIHVTSLNQLLTPSAKEIKPPS